MHSELLPIHRPLRKQLLGPEHTSHIEAHNATCTATECFQRSTQAHTSYLDPSLFSCTSVSSAKSSSRVPRPPGLQSNKRSSQLRVSGTSRRCYTANRVQRNSVWLHAPRPPHACAPAAEVARTAHMWHASGQAGPRVRVAVGLLLPPLRPACACVRMTSGHTPHASKAAQLTTA